MWKFKKFAPVALLALVVATHAYAAGPVPLSQGFTYQGRFFTPSGDQPMTDTVNLTISIYSGTGNCLLYQELDSNINLATTQGLYSIIVGSAVGDPKRTFAGSQDPGLTLAQIFSNNGQILPNGPNCAGGYTPASGEGRRLHVSIQSVTNGTTETLSPDLALGPVPQATVAETLQGLDPTEFIQTDNASNLSQSNAEALTTSELDVSALATPLHNHDSRYVLKGTGGNQNIGSGSFYTSGSLGVGTLAAPVATEVQIDATGAATKGLVIQGFNGQTANLFEVDNNLGSALVSIDKSGNLSLASNATFGLGTFAVAPANCATAGQIWYTGGQVQFCDGTGTVQTLGVSGAGISSLGGLTAATQNLSTGVAGTAPNWTTSGGNTQILNIPLASTPTVTAGLLSNADYTSFTDKVGGSSNLTSVGLLTHVSAAGTITQSAGLASSTTANVNQLLISGGSSQAATPELQINDDSSNSLFSMLKSGVMTLFNQKAATGSTELVVQAGAGQSTPLQTWLANGGGSPLYSINQGGSAVNSYDVVNKGDLASIVGANLSSYLPLTGGTLTGQLDLHTAPHADALAQILAATGADTNKGIVIQANSGSQSADLFEVQSSTGTVLAKIDASGNLTAASLSGSVAAAGLSGQVSATNGGTGQNSSAWTGVPSVSAGTWSVNSQLPVSLGGTGTNSGSITGTGALTFTAGGSNKNVTLTPSGTGYTVLNGNVGIGTTSPGALFDVGGKFTVDSGGTATGVILAGAGNSGGLLTPIYAVNKAGVSADNGAGIEFQGNSNTTLGDIGASYEDGTGANSYLSFQLRSSSTMKEKIRVSSSGNVGIGTLSPSAVLQLKAGTAAASTAPLKLTAGTNLTAPEAGAIEFDGTNLYYTDSTPTRRTLAVTGGSGSLSGLTAGRVPYATSATALADSSNLAWDNTNQTLTVTGKATKASMSLPTAATTNNISTLTVGSAISGNTGGAMVGVNAPNGYGGDLLDIQLNSVRKFRVDTNDYAFLGGAGGFGGYKIGSSGSESVGLIGSGNANSSDYVYLTTNSLDRLHIDGNGNVGIGTASPADQLVVKANGSTNQITIQNQSDTNAALYMTAAGGNAGYVSMLLANSEKIRFNANGASFFNSGNVGIGTTNPGTKLEIDGTSGATLKIVDGNQAANRVLTSDANGVASWAAPASMVYPGAGIPNSTGAAWGSSYTTSGSGTVLALTTSPTFTTPTLGAATATTVNGLSLTANATGFSVAGGTTSKTLTVNNTLTLAGTDGSTLNIGGGGTLGTAAYTAASTYQTALTNPLTYSGALTNGHVAVFNGTNQIVDGGAPNGGQWASGASLIYYTGGKVGIGTTGPTNALDILVNNSSTSTPNLQLTNSNSAGKAEFQAVNDGGNSMAVGTFGSGYSFGLANQAVLSSSTNGVILMSDGSTASGGTDPISFRTGGYDTTQERMRITSAGNVGIGTTSPSSLLTVGPGTDTPSDTVHTLYVTDNGTTNISVRDSSSHVEGEYWVDSSIVSVGSISDTPFQLKTHDNTRLYIKNTGEVGIGTTTPAGILDVEGGTAAANTAGTNINIYAQNGGTGNKAGGNINLVPGQANGTGNPGGVNISTVNNSAGGSNGLSFTNYANGTTGSGVGAAMYMQGTRGTTAATAALQTGDGLGYLYFQGMYNTTWSPGTGAYLYSQATANFTSSSTPAFLSFGTTPSGSTFPTERMRIDSTGKVGIGTTSPQTALQVNGVISSSTDNTNTLGSASYRFTTVYATNSTINTSDVREKKDIEGSDLGLDFLSKLRPVSYRWKSGPDSELHYGLIAQETEKVMREAKKDSSSKTVPIVDHDAATDKYGLRYTELISPIIKGIQELYRKVQDLYAKFAVHDKAIAELQSSRAPASLSSDLTALKNQVERLRSENARKDSEISTLKSDNAAIKTWACAQTPRPAFCR